MDDDEDFKSPSLHSDMVKQQKEEEKDKYDILLEDHEIFTALKQAILQLSSGEILMAHKTIFTHPKLKDHNLDLLDWRTLFVRMDDILLITLEFDVCKKNNISMSDAKVVCDQLTHYLEDRLSFDSLQDIEQ